MIKVSCKDFDVFVTYTDELEKEHTATAFCKSPEAAKGLVAEVQEAIELGYGFAKCRAILEGDTVNSWGGKRPGSGRPAAGEDLKKPRSIKFSDAEWETVKKKADAEGISASEYVRACTLGYKKENCSWGKCEQCTNAK